MKRVFFLLLVSKSVWAMDLTYDHSDVGSKMCEAFGQRKSGCEAGDAAMCVRNVVLQTTPVTRAGPFPKHPTESELIKWLFKQNHANMIEPLSKTEGLFLPREEKAKFKDYQFDATKLPDGTVIVLKSESGCAGGPQTIGLICGKSFVQISKTNQDENQVALIKTPTETAFQHKGPNGKLVNCIQKAIVRNNWVKVTSSSDTPKAKDSSVNGADGIK